MNAPRHEALAALVCALWASASAAGAAPEVVQVRLSVEEPPRVEGAAQVRAGGVLRLRVVEPGRLSVKVGGQVVAGGHLGWGEDERLMLDEVKEGTPALPRVVNAEPGQEEVEVALPEEAEDEEWVELRYTWAWRYQGRPALERKWRFVASEEQVRQQALAQAFEEEFPLGEEAQDEVEAAPGEEETAPPADSPPRATAASPRVPRARRTRPGRSSRRLRRRLATGCFNCRRVGDCEVLQERW